MTAPGASAISMWPASATVTKPAPPLMRSASARPARGGVILSFAPATTSAGQETLGALSLPSHALQAAKSRWSTFGVQRSSRAIVAPSIHSPGDSAPPKWAPVPWPNAAMKRWALSGLFRVSASRPGLTRSVSPAPSRATRFVGPFGLAAASTAMQAPIEWPMTATSRLPALAAASAAKSTVQAA